MFRRSKLKHGSNGRRVGKQTDIQELYDFVDRHDLGEVQISVDSHKTCGGLFPLFRGGSRQKRLLLFT